MLAVPDSLGPAFLDSSRLAAQWEDASPRARALVDASQPNSWAWASALRCMSAAWMKAQHPTETLERALTAYQCFGCSTSGVEQNFSKSELLVGVRRQGCHLLTEELLVKTGLDLPQLDRQSICARAREIWEECFDAPHAYPERRLKVAGQKKRKASTETEFISKRRAAARSAMDALPEPVRRDAEDPGLVARGEGWGESHAKELQFQRAEERDKRVDALGERTLLPHEVTPALRRTLAQKVAKRLKGQKDRQRTAARVDAKLSGVCGAFALSKLRGQKAFVQKGCQSSALTLALGRHGLVASACVDAECFVVGCPGRACEFIGAAPALRGSFQISPGLLLSDGKRGVAVKYKPSCHIPKTVFVAPAFALSQAKFCKFLGKLMGSVAGCAWKVEFEDWPRLRAEVPRCHLFALARSTELGMFGDFANAFTLAKLLVRMARVDDSMSVSGLA